jgi:hypothetical protein
VIALWALEAVATGVVLTVLLSLLVRDPRNMPLRAVTVAVGSFVLTVVFSNAATGATILGVAPPLARLTQHLGMLIGAYSLIAFYIFSALDPDAARRAARRQAVPFGIAALLLLVDFAVIPARIRLDVATLAFTKPGAPALTPWEQVTTAVETLTPNAYMGIAFAAAVLWTRRYARSAEPRLRHGLAVASVGLASLAFGEIWFVTASLAHWVGVPVAYWLFPIGLYFIMPGTAIFMVGFAYPAVRMRLAALRVWWQHRRTYRQLGPLWTLLHERFPENTLGRMPTSPWRDALSLRSVHRRYYRRVIECRDGLVRISPYLDLNASLAEALRETLQTDVAGASTPHRAVPLAIPTTHDLDADARELVTLSQALRHSAAGSPVAQLDEPVAERRAGDQVERVGLGDAVEEPGALAGDVGEQGHVELVDQVESHE